MGSDGAELGVSAERALGTILGDQESPGEDEQMSDEAFEAWIRECPAIVNEYGETARLAAKRVLLFLEEFPEARTLAIETEGAWCDAAGVQLTQEQLREKLPEGAEFLAVKEGLYDEMKRQGAGLADLDLTGFMWGWAFNAAHKVLGLPSQPNPTLLEVDC